MGGTPDVRRNRLEYAVDSKTEHAMSGLLHPYLSDSPRGRAVWHTGALLQFKALGEETDGRFWALEGLGDRRMVIGPHSHDQYDELWYVLEGEIIFTVGEKTFSARPGSFIHIPRGVQHAVQVQSTSARWLGAGIPAGLDLEFFETGEPALELSLPPSGLGVGKEPAVRGVAAPCNISVQVKEQVIMSAVAVALPILPGKSDEWKRVIRDATGPRRAELDDMHRRLKIENARWFLQPTPNGDVAIVYLEGPGAAEGFAKWGMSQEPFDVWFKQNIGPTYGIDFSTPPPGPGPEMVYDFRG